MNFGRGLRVLMVAAAACPFPLVGAMNAESPTQADSKDGARKPGTPCLRITPFEFGAVGDGVADDTKALQAAGAAAAIAKKTALVSPMSAVYAVSTDGSGSFVRWQGTPEPAKTSGDASMSS